MSRVTEIFESMSYGSAPEGDAPAREWLARNGGELGHFVDGRWTAPGQFLDVMDPATGTRLARVSRGTQGDVDAAVAAARRAQPAWRALGGHGRARHLYALARAVQKHSRLLAVIETLESGEPIRETRDSDLPLVARHFYHHAGWAQLLEREFPGFAPAGVAGQIISRRFPLRTLARKVAPALAAGCTVVLEPAEHTPLSALCFAELAHAAGLPVGVLNVVTGDGETGEAMVAHPDVDKLAFTGSTEVGRQIRIATAGSGKKLSLELSGSDPFIVFGDADLDSAVEGVADAIWIDQGQVRCAVSRLLAQEGIAERLEAKLRARMERLRVGSPLDMAVDIGLADASAAALGPVLAPITFRTPAEAVELANNTPYGLAASVWSENINLALDVAPKLKCGVVWVNSTSLFDAAAGFGGCRESGFGRDGGREGMYEYLVPAWEKEDLDLTPKLSSGSERTGPGSDRAHAAHAPYGRTLGDVGEKERDGIHNAVTAALAASGWASASGHDRARVLYSLAEKLAAHADEFARRLDAMTGLGRGAAEVDATIARLFTYAAWADKYDGAVHGVPIRGVALAMHEPVGVVGIACPFEAPLLGFISLVAPVVAMGNTAVVIPSEPHPLAAIDFHSVIGSTDLPAGVVNIITGARDTLARSLAEHDAVDALWYFGSREGVADVERASAVNMKRTWATWTQRDWFDPEQGEGREVLRNATQVKNIWIPYGE